MEPHTGPLEDQCLQISTDPLSTTPERGLSIEPLRWNGSPRPRAPRKGGWASRLAYWRRFRLRLRIRFQSCQRTFRWSCTARTQSPCRRNVRLRIPCSVERVDWERSSWARATLACWTQALEWPRRNANEERSADTKPGFGCQNCMRAMSRDAEFSGTSGSFQSCDHATLPASSWLAPLLAIFRLVLPTAVAQFWNRSAAERQSM